MLFSFSLTTVIPVVLFSTLAHGLEAQFSQRESRRCVHPFINAKLSDETCAFVDDFKTDVESRKCISNYPGQKAMYFGQVSEARDLCVYASPEYSCAGDTRAFQIRLGGGESLVPFHRRRKA
jgi:hypothetical protein